MNKDPTLENVTPNKAEKWLNSNNLNRTLRPGVAEKYAEDMKAGQWTQCTAPIVFYEDGNLADGQHRLWAVVESGTTQKFIIVRDLPREAGLNIDIGLGRTLVDNARISGANDSLSHILLAVTRAVAQGVKQSATRRNYSGAQRLAMVDEHGEASRWAIANGPKTRVYRQSVVLAAVARAYYHEEDKVRLAQFAKILDSGFMEGEGDSAAIALRNYIIVNGTGIGRAETWKDTFFKVQNTISYFMRRRKLTVIKSVKEEAYPLPVKKAAKKAK